MRSTSGSGGALAEVAAIFAIGFAALRARPTAAHGRARKAQEQAQFPHPSDSPELSGYPPALETYVVVAAQDTQAEKEAQ
jgi:hypothetical protein